MTMVTWWLWFYSDQGGVGAGLGDMFGQLDLGSEEGEDQLMKMMQGMMSTLLSKEVLYPSLKELCKQVRRVSITSGGHSCDTELWVTPVQLGWRGFCMPVHLL